MHPPCIFDRERAIQRGMEFIYDIARNAENFAMYGSDLLFCFAFVASIDTLSFAQALNIYCLSKTPMVAGESRQQMIFTIAIIRHGLPLMVCVSMHGVARRRATSG